MGRPYTRLKYEPPEKYKPNGLIGHGEAVSMITDLLVPCGERRDMRRQVDNHVRYAVKNGTFGKSRAGIFRFDEIAAWANERYGKENPNISRMHHGEIVEVGRGAPMRVLFRFGHTRGMHLLAATNECGKRAQKLVSPKREIFDGYPRWR